MNGEKIINSLLNFTILLSETRAKLKKKKKVNK